jgi:formylmethanofuran dehydrogenase subunit E
MHLSISLQEHLQRSALLHSRLCPRQVLGARMARLACQTLGIDPAIERKRIFVIMEIGRCAADAVMMVTGANPMNQLMQLVDYGKVAATFVDLQTQTALRISELAQSREAALDLYPHLPKWEAQRDAYQVLPDAALFHWQAVSLNIPLPHFQEKYAVTCAACGDRVHDHAEVVRDGRTLCKVCAGAAYFTPLDAVAVPPRGLRACSD